MAKTTVMVPANGGPIEAVSTIETVPYWTRSRRKTGKIECLSPQLKQHYGILEEIIGLSTSKAHTSSGHGYDAVKLVVVVVSYPPVRTAQTVQ